MRSKVLVIGGGVAGCGLAYHVVGGLTKLRPSLSVRSRKMG
jgi:L-2-hydroxyglutarate oxidase LhgO